MHNPQVITQKNTYYVQGMHCKSCEMLIEGTLSNVKGVTAVKVDTSKNKVFLDYEGNKPTTDHLNTLLRSYGYTFSEELPQKTAKANKASTLSVVATSLLIIVAFVLLSKSGLSSLVNPTAASSLPSFFVLGLLAGFSTCAALVGSLVLSLSKRWNGSTEKDASDLSVAFRPYALFNIGRLLSYTLLGALLGLIGSKIQFFPSLSAALVILVSLFMVLLALDMLGIKVLDFFKSLLPKKIIQNALVKHTGNTTGLSPLILGALTFFLPCGFTLTAQSLALLSGSALRGTMIMLLFALGTLPSLLLIGATSVRLVNDSTRSEKFLKIAGVLVLFFALFNLNSQMNVLGLTSANNLSFRAEPNGKTVNSETSSKQSDPETKATQQSPTPAKDPFTSANNVAPIIEGKQLIHMQASSRGYSPSYFRVRINQPVRWEIEDIGTSGCTNAVISKDLFQGEIALTPGQTSTKEFTPTKTGIYKFSCWMGMVIGEIEVVS